MIGVVVNECFTAAIAVNHHENEERPLLYATGGDLYMANNQKSGTVTGGRKQLTRLV